MRDVTEPDAEALRDLRVHLEHKSVKVHEMGPFPPQDGEPKDLFFDDLAYSLNRRDLEAKGLRMLKLARAALIYLALGMHQEERRRAAGKGDGGLVMPMTIETYPDQRKT